MAQERRYPSGYTGASGGPGGVSGGAGKAGPYAGVYYHWSGWEGGRSWTAELFAGVGVVLLWQLPAGTVCSPRLQQLRPPYSTSPNVTISNLWKLSYISHICCAIQWCPHLSWADLAKLAWACSVECILGDDDWYDDHWYVVTMGLSINSSVLLGWFDYYKNATMINFHNLLPFNPRSFWSSLQLSCCVFCTCIPLRFSSFGLYFSDTATLYSGVLQPTRKNWRDRNWQCAQLSISSTWQNLRETSGMWYFPPRPQHKSLFSLFSNVSINLIREVVYVSKFPRKSGMLRLWRLELWTYRWYHITKSGFLFVVHDTC